jgi:hypothetical protein
MDGQLTLGRLINAIQLDDIRDEVGEILEKVKDRIVALVERFTETDVNPQTTFDFEETLASEVRELGRNVEQWVFNTIEPATLSKMPGTIKHRNRSYRRLADKSPNPHVVTAFGRICLTRARYRQGRAGQIAFPLEIALGIDQGFTPAAANMVGRQFAICGSSQGRTIDVIEERTGAKIGSEKLRNIVRSLAAGMEPYREECQLEKIMSWIKLVQKDGKSPLISVSRDGVSLGIASLNSFEMASVATISVMSEGEKLGTVYIGRAPETNQKVLTDQLTSLLREIVRACGEAVPEIVYVTDAGKVETAYWKNVLRKFFVDGQRIKITRVVDYYHAAERLTTIANALKFGKNKQGRADWLRDMRKLLLQPGGWGRVMRSIAKMKAKYKYKAHKSQDAKAAEKYLRRYRRFMNYYDLRARNYPIGSGIVESACKQVVSERLKLSGMRWEHEGAQQTITLRCILLSNVWDAVFSKYLSTKQPVNDVSVANAA